MSHDVNEERRTLIRNTFPLNEVATSPWKPFVFMRFL